MVRAWEWNSKFQTSKSFSKGANILGIRGYIIYTWVTWLYIQPYASCATSKFGQPFFSALSTFSLPVPSQPLSVPVNVRKITSAQSVQWQHLARPMSKCHHFSRCLLACLVTNRKTGKVEHSVRLLLLKLPKRPSGFNRWLVTWGMDKNALALAKPPAII